MIAPRSFHPDDWTSSSRRIFPEAPLCPTHDPTRWHGLWDSAEAATTTMNTAHRFTPEVAAAFPGLICGAASDVEIGHCIRPVRWSIPQAWRDQVECRTANSAGLCDRISRRPRSVSAWRSCNGTPGAIFPRNWKGDVIYGVSFGSVRLRAVPTTAMSTASSFRSMGRLGALSGIYHALPAELLTGLGLCIWSILECALCL